MRRLLMTNQLELFATDANIPTKEAIDTGNYTRLIDLFPADMFDVPQLYRTEHTHRSNTAELRLLAQTSQLISGFCVDLTGFVKELNQWLQTTSLGNHACFWTTYIIVGDEHKAEIWHTNALGDPDRHVCTVQPLRKL